jgi:hypothetical protein
MFSNLSSSSISFATETPSFVTVGAPKLLSEALVENCVAALRTQRHFYCVGEDIHASEHLVPRVVAKTYFFSSHVYFL